MGISRTAADVLSGTTGGIAQVMVGQPFDIVKVRLQTAPKGTYTGIADCAGRILRDQGPLGFYRGTLTPLLGVGACVSIQFGVVGAVKRYFAEKNGPEVKQLKTSQLYTAGMTAGIANSIVAGPVEHIRIRLQAQQEKIYSGPLDCVAKIVRQSGWTGVFRGMVPTMLREGHGMGVYFLTYEYLVQRKLQGRSREELSSTWAMLFGGSAGIALWLSAYPIDVVKSRMQTDSLNRKEQAYKSMRHCIQQIWKTGGWRDFFRGLAPTLVRAPFANAATFVVYEASAQYLEKYTHQHVDIETFSVQV